MFPQPLWVGLNLHVDPQRGILLEWARVSVTLELSKACQGGLPAGSVESQSPEKTRSSE